MAKEVKVYVRDVLFKTMMVQDSDYHISFILSGNDNSSYQANIDLTEEAFLFDTITVPIMAYSSTSEYRAVIDDPEIIIWDKNNIKRIPVNTYGNSTYGNTGDISLKDIYKARNSLYNSSEKIESRFEILDL